jgi:hypothetical protein
MCGGGGRVVVGVQNELMNCCAELLRVVNELADGVLALGVCVAAVKYHAPGVFRGRM